MHTRVRFSLIGGFTRFGGVVLGSSGPGVGSFINGSLVCPNSGCNTTADFLSMSFPTPQQTVDFFNGVFVTPNTPNQVQLTPAGPQLVTGPETSPARLARA